MSVGQRPEPPPPPFSAAPSAEVRLAEFRDAFFPHEPGVKEFFEQLKADFVPDVVLTHARHDLHQDHRVTCELAWNTFRDHLIFEYEIPKYDADLGSPNVFVPLDERLARRKADLLVEHFASQRAKYWFTADVFLSLDALTWRRVAVADRLRRGLLRPQGSPRPRRARRVAATHSRVRLRSARAGAPGSGLRRGRSASSTGENSDALGGLEVYRVDEELQPALDDERPPQLGCVVLAGPVRFELRAQRRLIEVGAGRRSRSDENASSIRSPRRPRIQCDSSVVKPCLRLRSTTAAREQ